MSIGHRMIYYHLLFNHNTHCNDTIKANSKEELKQGIIDTTDDGAGEDGNAGIIILVVVLLVVALAFAFGKYLNK